MLHSITDVHAHYDEAVFDTDRGEVLRTLREAGVCAIVNSLERAVLPALTGPGETVRGSICQCRRISVGGLQRAVRLVGADLRYGGGGRVCGRWRDRTGLPFGGWRRSHIRAAGDAKNVFRAQLELARRKGMPVVIHDRDADEDVIRLLAELPCPGMIHRFFSRAEYGFQLLEMGLSLGIGPAVTYSNAGELVQVVRQMPLERLLLETDAPFYPAPALKANGRLRI